MISSFSNAFVKAVKKLSDHRERLHTKTYLIEGLHIVGEALDRHQKIETLIVAPDILVSEYGISLLQKAEAQNCAVVEFSKEVFTSISGRDGPQGIAAIIRQNWSTLKDTHPVKGEIWVALESIQNPGNLGTIMRTADSVGARGVLLLDHSTDPYDPTSVKASMGALYNLKIIKSDLAEFSGWVSREGIPLIGSSDRANQDYHTYQFPDPCVLLMGSEREGLPQEYLDLCTEVVCIPMEGRSDSLNLAIATSVILYQVYNQRRSGH